MKRIIPLLILMFVVVGFASAQESDFNAGKYRFFLYFDEGQLFSDRDFEFKYDIIAGDFVPETITADFPYKIEVIDVGNSVLSQVDFDPRKGNEDFTEGKIIVDVPYFANAKEVRFSNNRNEVLLTLDVSESSFCNDDGTCNADVGENVNTCPNDCRTTPKTSRVPVDTADTSAGTSGGIAGIIVTVVIVLVVAGGGWYGWKWWQTKRASGVMMPPPDISSSSDNNPPLPLADDSPPPLILNNDTPLPPSAVKPPPPSSEEISPPRPPSDGSDNNPIQ